MSESSEESRSPSPDPAGGFGGTLQRIRTRIQGKRQERADEQRRKEQEREASLYIDYDEEPPLAPLKLTGYKANTKRKLLGVELAEELRQHVPSMLQICHEWSLLYSMEQDGMSLNTLYADCAPQIGENTHKRRGYFLLVEDADHTIFGAYLNEPLKPQEGRTYYGNGDCFLWKTEKATVMDLSRETDPVSAPVPDPSPVPAQQAQKRGSIQDHTEEHLRLKVFPYTRVNDFIIYSDHNFISVGSGGGKFGLWISNTLQHGASDPVDTFGNEQLSKKEKFSILGLEIWKINV